MIILVCMLTKVNIVKENTMVSNTNLNKTLDLTAMAIKIEQIQMNDKYYVLDTFTGDMTAYMADCPLCNGTLGCMRSYDITDGKTTYPDEIYGNVRIVASSKNLPCGSIVRFNSSRISEEPVLAIVLDRGVRGNALDLLSKDIEYAYMVGRSVITYDVLREGWAK